MYSRDPVDLLTDELNHVRQCLGQEQSANRVLATSKPASCERQLIVQLWPIHARKLTSRDLNKVSC